LLRLQVDYLEPTPIGVELELRGMVIKLKGKKVISEIAVSANGIFTVRGKVIAMQGNEMSQFHFLSYNLLI